MPGFMESLRLLRLGTPWNEIEVDDKVNATIATSFLLSKGRMSSDDPDRQAVEGLNEQLAADVTKVRISFTKIELKTGAIRWQVSMKSTNSEDVETTDLNTWAPTVMAGVWFILLKLLGGG